jgi:hypothetical protein
LLLQKYKGEFDIGFTDILKHKIDTGNHAPIREPLRRHPLPYLTTIDNEVDKMLQHNIVSPSTSDWSSNVCLVRKSDGSMRFTVDYRRLNLISKHDSYPLPKIDSCLDTWNRSCYFSTIDLRSAFWQVAMDDNDADKTSFVTRKGCYKFNVLPFGLTGSPGTFQRLMDMILSGLTWDISLVYLDDVIVFSRTIDKHITRLEKVFQRIHDAKLKIKYEKCKFLQSEVCFLGSVKNSNGVQTDDRKTEAIRNWTRPCNVKQLRSFLGTSSYYRKFVNKFSCIAAPLFELTKKGIRFISMLIWPKTVVLL